MQIVLDTKNLKVTRRRNMFYFDPPEGGGRSISPRKITSIAVVQPALIDSGAVQLAAEYEIPILFFSPTGKVVSRLSGPGFGSIAGLRRAQVRFSETPDAARWMIGLYLLKLQHQEANLRRLKLPEHYVARMRAQGAKMETLAGKLLSESGAQLMAAEAVAARLYWQALAEALPAEFNFEKRTRMPAQDNFNAALNYLYGMLYSVVEGGLHAVGLDPHLGLLHTDEYNKPVLAYDFIEPFRPWVDWLLIEQFTAGRIKTTFFKRGGGGVLLDKEGKAFLIPLFNQWLRSERTHDNRKTNVKNHIYQLAARLAAKLRKNEQESTE